MIKRCTLRAQNEMLMNWGTKIVRNQNFSLKKKYHVKNRIEFLVVYSLDLNKCFKHKSLKIRERRFDVMNSDATRTDDKQEGLD